MKKLLAFLLTFATVGTSLALSAGATRDLTYNAPKATPKVDGEMEALWDSAEWTDIDLPYDADKDNYGHSARAKLMWDETNLYIYAEVTEPSTADWNDTFEVYFDELGDKAASYESDDTQNGFWKDGLRPGYGTMNREVFIDDCVVTYNDTQFIVEAAIPWLVIEPVGGEKLGLEFMLNIEKADGTFVQALRWNVDTANGDTAPWQGTSNFGDLVLVAETEAAPETEAETEPETVPETEAETEPETAPETEAETEPETVEAPAETVETTTAPQTFDIGIIAAAAAAVSAAGYAVSKKRR